MLLKLFSLSLLVVSISSINAAAVQAKAAGALVSTMIYYLGQNEYVLNLAVTNIDDATDYKFIQELLPKGTKDSRTLESFTSYDEVTVSVTQLFDIIYKYY